MQMQSLTISPKQPYSKPGPANPYQAKLSVTYNENTMQVTLSQDACARILALAGDEIAEAAQIQIRDFVQQALSVASAPMIEGTVEERMPF